MEITFEGENSDFDIVFESDLLSENFSDRSQTSWQFQNSNHSFTLASVFTDVCEDQDTSSDILPTLRLCCRCHD